MPLRTQLEQIKPALMLLGLSVLWSLDALRSDAWPALFRRAADSPTFVQSAVHWSVLAVGATILAVIRRALPSKRGALHAALIGLGIFVIPALLAHAAADHITDQTRVILFMLTPLFAVIFEPFLEAQNTTQPGRSMVTVLVTVAGALLLFSLRLPGSIKEGGAFCLIVFAAACLAAANCWAVRVTQCNESVSIFMSAAIGACAAALVFAGLGMAFEPQAPAMQRLWPEALWGIVVDLPALLAFFWLLSHMSAARMTLRFILAPLSTALLSLVLFQPAVSLRAAAGIALMATGTACMLFAPESGDAARGSLLQVDGDDSN